MADPLPIELPNVAESVVVKLELSPGVPPSAVQLVGAETVPQLPLPLAFHTP